MSVSTLSSALWALLLTAPCGRSHIPPEYATNLTVYHVNPASAGAVPINMDTGDARGDLFFFLRSFLTPFFCENSSRLPPFVRHLICENPEVVSTDLVATRVELEVDMRLTGYSACNLCNGTDPFSGLPCQLGTYVCDAFGVDVDPRRVGSLNITHKFTGNESPFARICVPSLRPLGCWSANIPKKTGGFWYSTLAAGLCNISTSAGACSWRVKATHTVMQDCLTDRFAGEVEARNQSCFHACGPRNTTGRCWVTCLMDTTLGYTAGDTDVGPLGGMAIHDIESAWLRAFLPTGEGGCPPVSIPEYAQGSAPPTALLV